MSAHLVVLPILWPLLLAIVLLLTHGRLAVQRALAIACSLGGLVIAVGLTLQAAQVGVLSTQASNWPAPYGITLVIDLFAGIMLMLTWFLATVCLAFALRSVDERRQRTFFYPLVFLLLMGIGGSFTTGDIFNLFVWFEVLLISSYVLLFLGGEARQLRETFKYVILNVLASALYLVMISLIYGTVGTLNMAHLAELAAKNPNHPIWPLIAAAFLVVFGLKAAIFPLYTWLPGAYTAPSSALSALFAGLLTKVGVYALIRLFTLLHAPVVGWLQPVLLTVAGVTMVLGVLGAVAQIDIRRILAFHSISQVGYMILGLGLFSTAGVAGAIYFMLHHAVVKSGLFLVGGVVEEVSGTTDLRKVHGLIVTHPGLAALFFIAAASLAGIPPASGFLAKFALVQDGLARGHYVIIAVALAVSLLTLFSMIKIFRYGFWGEAEGKRRRLGDRYISLTAPVAVLVVATAALGLAAGPVYTLLLTVAGQLMNPQAYILAVLGRG